MAKVKTYINEITVNCIQNAINNNEFESSSIKLEDVSRIKIDKIEIRYSPHNFMMYYDTEVNKDYLDTWKKDVGGVIRNDFKKDQLDDYFIIKTFGSKTLAKRLGESDSDIVLRFGSTKLLTIGDFQYLPLKTVDLDKTFLSSSYVFNNFIDVISNEDKKREHSNNNVFDEDEEDCNNEFSQEDMDLLNYYTPESE